MEKCGFVLSVVEVRLPLDSGVTTIGVKNIRVGQYPVPPLLNFGLGLIF